MLAEIIVTMAERAHRSVGAGSALVDPAAVKAGRFDMIRDNARGFVEAVASARERMPAGVTS